MAHTKKPVKSIDMEIDISKFKQLYNYQKKLMYITLSQLILHKERNLLI